MRATWTVASQWPWRATMGLILRWGLGVGIAIALVDFAAGEMTRSVTGTDLAAAIELIDYVINLVLFGWAGYQVARAAGELRPGLESAVLAGLLAGLAGVGYMLARGGEATAPEELVFLVAWNIVLAASAGAVGAWSGSTARREAPPGSNRGARP